MLHNHIILAAPREYHGVYIHIGEGSYFKVGRDLKSKYIKWPWLFESGSAYKQCCNAYSQSGSAHKQYKSGSAHKQCENGLFAEHSQNFNLFQK